MSREGCRCSQRRAGLAQLFRDRAWANNVVAVLGGGSNHAGAEPRFSPIVASPAGAIGCAGALAGRRLDLGVGTRTLRQRQDCRRLGLVSNQAGQSWLTSMSTATRPHSIPRKRRTRVGRTAAPQFFFSSRFLGGFVLAPEAVAGFRAVRGSPVSGVPGSRWGMSILKTRSSFGQSSSSTAGSTVRSTCVARGQTALISLDGSLMNGRLQRTTVCIPESDLLLRNGATFKSYVSLHGAKISMATLDMTWPPPASMTWNWASARRSRDRSI